MKTITGCMQVLILSAFTMSTNAAVINYNESVDGDLDYPAPSFMLDIGANVFTGSFQFTVSSADFIWDFDNFNITIMPDHQIESVIFDYQVTERDPQGEMIDFYLGIDNFPAANLQVPESKQDSITLISDLPSVAGEYAVDLSSFITTRGDFNDSIVDYTLTFNVIEEQPPAIVPIPAASWLFCSGVLALFSMRRKYL